MRGIYRLLLRLYPAHVRREFGEEMAGVFDAASVDQWNRGLGSYAVFCIREITGLVTSGLLQEEYRPL